MVLEMVIGSEAVTSDPRIEEERCTGFESLVKTESSGILQAIQAKMPPLRIEFARP